MIQMFRSACEMLLNRFGPIWAKEFQSCWFHRANRWTFRRFGFNKMRARFEWIPCTAISLFRDFPISRCETFASIPNRTVFRLIYGFRFLKWHRTTCCRVKYCWCRWRATELHPEISVSTKVLFWKMFFDLKSHLKNSIYWQITI